MSQEAFSAVDEYVSALLAPEDEGLQGALDAAEAAGLPAIQVSPPQGKMLHLLAQARRSGCPAIFPGRPRGRLSAPAA